MVRFSRNSRTSRSYSKKSRGPQSPYSLSPVPIQPIRVKAEECANTTECLMLTIEESDTQHEEYFSSSDTYINSEVKEEPKIKSIETDEIKFGVDGSIQSHNIHTDVMVKEEPGIKAVEANDITIENSDNGSIQVISETLRDAHLHDSEDDSLIGTQLIERANDSLRDAHLSIENDEGYVESKLYLRFIAEYPSMLPRLIGLKASCLTLDIPFRQGASTSDQLRALRSFRVKARDSMKQFLRDTDALDFNSQSPEARQLLKKIHAFFSEVFEKALTVLDIPISSKLDLTSGAVFMGRKYNRPIIVSLWNDLFALLARISDKIMTIVHPKFYLEVGDLIRQQTYSIPVFIGLQRYSFPAVLYLPSLTWHAPI